MKAERERARAAVLESERAIDELVSRCDELAVRYEHDAGVDGLRAVIERARSSRLTLTIEQRAAVQGAHDGTVFVDALLELAPQRGDS